MSRLRTSPPEPPLPRLRGSVLPEWAPRPTVSSLRRTLCERLACAHVPGAGHTTRGAGHGPSAGGNVTPGSDTTNSHSFSLGFNITL